MSEYQYYEFQAIDRPLDSDARAALRKITSRADITATSLINEYHFGDFKGNPAKLMEQYFDAHLYFANWGSHTVMLRVPLAGLTMADAEPYLPNETSSFSAWATKEHLIFDFSFRDEGGDLDFDEDDGGSLAAIIPIRNELLSGDCRPLYLGWLLSVQMGDEDEDTPEPPVPPGLKTLSGPQQALADFLDLDSDLLDAAAERSALLHEEADPAEEAERAAWVKALPDAEKDSHLLRLLRGEGMGVGLELQRRFRDEQASKHRKGSAAAPAEEPRTAAELLARAEEIADERKERESRKREQRRQEEERRQAAAREKYLDSLAGREEHLWTQAESLIATKAPGKYDEAVAILLDLRDLADRAGSRSDFTTRLDALRNRHATKRSFVERLAKKGLA